MFHLRFVKVGLEIKSHHIWNRSLVAIDKPESKSNVTSGTTILAMKGGGSFMAMFGRLRDNFNPAAGVAPHIRLQKDVYHR